MMSNSVDIWKWDYDKHTDSAIKALVNEISGFDSDHTILLW